MRRILLWLGLAAFCGCGQGFDPIGDIESVRVLAASATEPYAKPGDMVTVSLDAWDGRPMGGADPMVIYWLPFVCEDPADDLYYACFASLVAPGTDGGTSDGGTPGMGGFPPNIDVTDFLQQGPETSFTMPADAITSHAFVQGVPEQYGVVFLFALACAGRVRTLPIDPSGGDGLTVPLGCFDDQGTELGPDDYVFTYTRVYAYDTITNANPVIQGAVFDGQPVDLNAGVVVQHCDPNTTCDTHAINVNVPASSWSSRPGLRPSPTAPSSTRRSGPTTTSPPAR